MGSMMEFGIALAVAAIGMLIVMGFLFDDGTKATKAIYENNGTIDTTWEVFQRPTSYIIIGGNKYPRY
jgi:hypothetical protein